jgi:N-acetyltransferase
MPAPPITPVELRGQTVALLPMEPGHTTALYEASRDEVLWQYMPVWVDRPEDMEHWVRNALEEQASGKALPFVILHRPTGRIVGSTRYLDIDRKHRNLEIGWTWLAPEARRTPVNTECKRLLLGHAFEALGMIRVQLKTDARNLTSQRAIERIGATREGVLRHHRIMPDGYLRDTVVYSILAGEWPEVKHRLEERLAAG